MAEQGKGTHVEWSWVAAVAVSLLVLTIGSLWQEKAKQAAEDHSELGKVTTQIADVTREVETIKTSVDRVGQNIENLSKASNARWGALLEALPEVEKKLRRTTPVFAPEWNYNIKRDEK